MPPGRSGGSVGRSLTNRPVVSLDKTLNSPSPGLKSFTKLAVVIYVDLYHHIFSVDFLWALWFPPTAITEMEIRYKIRYCNNQEPAIWLMEVKCYKSKKAMLE